MSASPHIRLAVPADAQALGEIQAASHLATYRGVMPDSILARVQAERLIERFRSRLTAAAEAPGDDRQRLWVIHADGAIAGYAITEPGAHRFLPPPDGAGEMESLYLHPDAIGRGLGQALHRHAIDDLVARGFDPLVLWAFAANKQARRFYERAGWMLDVTGEHWVLNGVPCPIVRYRLAAPRA
jgi:ribosomal protein S18 acetylase RimI-like enzyme